MLIPTPNLSQNQSAMEFSVRLPPPVPFPSDINTASLVHVSLEKLLTGDNQESAELFEACKKAGFFLLDLQNVPLGETLMDDADALMALSEELFAMELEEKLKYRMPKGGFSGYKGIGMLRIDEKGTPDRCEFFGVLKDELLGISPVFNQPAVIEAHKELCISFTKKAHELALIILANLEKSLHLPSGTFDSLHRISEPSHDQTRLIRYPPQPASDRRTSFVAHTDFGSVTVLFNILGGLQILPNISTNDYHCIPSSSSSAWQFVRPVPGFAIINIGDAMTKFTNDLLRSGLHRVTSAPGDQGNVVRTSLAYFLRPENEVLMRRLEGGDVIPGLEEGRVEEGVVKSGEWVGVKGEGKKIGGEE
ncbi:2OG-Fe(II) oxygenase family protein [Rutstroemia sp. NJR-2017a WRK4]|nr:2OG-Fe(II) oxygenase family protein [Rutstroemia sp. NJR-2017a WRK4]